MKTFIALLFLLLFAKVQAFSQNPYVPAKKIKEGTIKIRKTTKTFGKTPVNIIRADTLLNESSMPLKVIPYKKRKKN